MSEKLSLEDTVTEHISIIEREGEIKLADWNIDSWWYALELEGAHEYLEDPEPAKVLVTIGFDKSAQEGGFLTRDYCAVDWGYRDNQLNEFSKKIVGILEDKGLEKHY